VGYLASKQELVAVIRRVDLDGDAKINLEEFNEGVRSQFSLTSSYASKTQPQKPNASFGAMTKQNSRSNIMSASKKSKSNVNTPMKSTASKLGKQKRKPQSANKASTANKHRNNVLSQIYGISSSGKYNDSTPSKLNKSVTFNNKVKVREYGGDNQYQTPSKNLQSEFGRSHLDFSPSPQRFEEPYPRQQTYGLRQLNLDQGSPMRPQKDYGDINGSPLRQSPMSRSLQTSIVHYPASVEKLRTSSIQSPSTREPRQVFFDQVEKGEVAKVFKDSIFLERELESAKIELALKPDFNLLDMFRMLDPFHRGYFQQQDLADNLSRHLQLDMVSNDDTYLFFQRYDRNRNGKITFSEFCQAVTPISKEYA